MQICKLCGKEFYSKRKRKYCSNLCSNVYEHKNISDGTDKHRSAKGFYFNNADDGISNKRGKKK